MSAAPNYEANHTCTECGCFGAYAFANESLCMDCYQQRGSCCAERNIAEEPEVCTLSTPRTYAIAEETHRLNPNCCYKACPRCSSVRRLREFQSRHPADWQSRLRGLPRLVAAAQLRE